MSSFSPELEKIKHLVDCQTIEQVWERYVAILLDFGFDRMIYAASRYLVTGEFGDPGDAIILTNHDQDYIDVFFGRELYFRAPMAIWAIHNTGTCSWQWAADRKMSGQASAEELEIMDINTRHGVTAGYSISFSHSFQRSGSGIGLCARRGLSQLEVDGIWERHGQEIDAISKVADLKILSLPFKRQGSKLTDRQTEVLQWVADGKTVNDIAVILNLSAATVEKHLRLARNNLNATTTAQAVLKATIQNQFFIFEGAPGLPSKENLTSAGDSPT